VPLNGATVIINVQFFGTFINARAPRRSLAEAARSAQEP